MAITKTSGALALSEIQTEFGGSNPISLSEYYAGGSNVSSGTTDGDGNAIPSSGAIKVSDFYDTSANSITRGVFAGGMAYTNIMAYITIATTGNAIDFGDLTVARGYPGGCSDGSRGLFDGGASAGGSPFTNSDVIDYITIATTGNATDFGNLTQGRYQASACASETRGVFSGGRVTSTNVNTMDYVTIQSTGNATDFGDLANGRGGNGACDNLTRGVISCGYEGLSNSNRIEYITIASTGNATDFGDATVARRQLASVDNLTRGVTGGGFSTVNTNIMDYVTIASTGNATDFGDLTVTGNSNGGLDDRSRGVFGGGTGRNNVMDYITIASTGNATDFGDLTTSSFYGQAGLSGG